MKVYAHFNNFKKNPVLKILCTNIYIYVLKNKTWKNKQKRRNNYR